MANVNKQDNNNKLIKDEVISDIWCISHVVWLVTESPKSQVYTFVVFLCPYFKRGI